MDQKPIQEYRKIAKVRVKRGPIFSGFRDPSEEVHHEIERFLRREKEKFDSVVRNTFELPEDGFVKFEFYWIPPRVERVADNPDSIAFRTNANITLLYLKQNSIIYFETSYLFSIKKGCSSTGELLYYGGKNYELSEIYFNKVTTVGAYHNEQMISVVSKGCMSQEARYTISEDGFIIRAGQNFKVIASEKHRSELQEARQHINHKILRLIYDILDYIFGIDIHRADSCRRYLQIFCAAGQQ